MEAKISHKREAMQIGHKLIPMMNEDEVFLLMAVYSKAIDRLIEEGSTFEEPEEEEQNGSNQV